MSCDYCNHPLYAGAKCKSCGREPAPVQPVSGVVLRDGLPTLLQDKHIKETDQRLCIIPPAQPAAQEPVGWMYPDDYERMLTSETFCTVYSVEVGSATRGESSVALYATPPAAAVQEGRDWSLLEATQESLREHMIEIKRLKEAQPAVQEVRLWDTQWTNVVNHDNAYRGWDKQDAINHAVKMTEQYIATNVLENKCPPAQPAVPDAMTSADIQEHIEYVAGWNDCRQAMMEMMK